jgi:hypothetical protein
LLPTLTTSSRYRLRWSPGVLLLHVNGIMDSHGHTGGINYRTFSIAHHGRITTAGRMR